MAINHKYRFPFASYPAVRLALLLSVGITIDYQLGLSTLLWTGLFAVLSLIYITTESIYQQALKSKAYNAAIICYLGMIVSFGGCWHSYFDFRDPPAEAQVINTYTWEKLAFTGTIEQVKQSSTGKYQIDVEVDTTFFPGKHLWPRFYRLRTVLDPDETAMSSDMQLGNRLFFSATVYPLVEKRNPSQFEYKKYLASQHIYSQAGIRDIHSISISDNALSWVYLRQQVLKAIENNFSDKNAPLAKALLIGYKNELDRSDKITFSRAGLSHIMAVSGLHVGFIIAPFWVIIPLFWGWRGGKQLGLLMLVGVLLCYAGLTGFSASVTRASIVGIFLAYGKLFHKVRDSKNLTAVAALIILLLNPSDLFSIGFQLSFGAVYVILLVTPVIQRQLPDWVKYRWFGTPVMVVIISFIVQVGLFPLLAYYFGEFSIVGPLANAFVVPFLGLVVPYALLMLPVTEISAVAGHILNTPVDFFLKQLQWFVDISASWSWSWIQVHVESLLFFMIWVSCIFLVASLLIPKLRWKAVILLLALLCIQQGKRIVQKLHPATLKLTIFDVGQGDATLVSTPNNKHFLIDTGRWQPDYNSAKYIIIPHLKKEGIEKLDAIFLSHPHADHIGGTIELIETVPVDTIYNSGAFYDSKLYHKYKRAAAEHQIPVVEVGHGDQIPLDSSLRLFIYGPSDSASESNVNNHSLVLEIIYGKTELLFMGDAESAQEKRLLQNYPNHLDTDFLKVAHHGSKTSSGNKLLEKISAQIGVVSLAKRNRFEHPHPEAVRRLRSNISNLYFTSLKGAIQFHSDGYAIYKHQ